ncbi:regulatory protein, tetR family [Nonomuraea solani]|uniref:Regulatory protein, tetR family n=1 Tax=Nonomuraea solani TaxID=1144553 RepID=A0A1H6EDT5_9ACTN|nr:TetR family transcriptional regulator [Nonomuraea solani]SEG95970.1 regulatory protein, tetR family [Nonomuraea solani]
MRRSSEDTKAAILRAAREHFAADGYDRATIRAIAATAGIDPSMVMRYFGSKQQLFATAADFDLRLPDVTGLPHDQVGHALAAHLVDRWGDGDVLAILLRTAVTNDQAAERMRAIFADQLTPLVVKLTGDPAQAHTRAGLVATQALGFALCRYVLRLPPVVALSRDEIIEWLGPTLRRYLIGS